MCDHVVGTPNCCLRRSNVVRHNTDSCSCTSLTTPALRVWQHHLTVEAAIPAAHDAQQKGALLQQLVQLTDLVLDGYKTEIEAVNQSAPDSAKLQELRHRYETDREALIKPFSERLCTFDSLCHGCTDVMVSQH